MNKLADFQEAYDRIRTHIRVSPHTFHAALNLDLKWENRQRTGSFKPRGALNKILTYPQEGRPAVWVTGSAGNHGQAVALAARLTGSRAIVFVPQATPRIKIEQMLALGAQVERVAGLFGDAEAKAIAFARQSGFPFLSPYNDEDVIRGAGTIALEWLDQNPDVERILVPVGGGGLICGVGLCAKLIKPQIEILGVLSENSAYLHSQYYRGHMEGVIERPTLTDGLAGAVEAGSITIELLSSACDGILQISEEEIAAGVVYLHHKLGETVEGSGAVGLAAVLSGRVQTQDRPTGALVSGGNIDSHKLSGLLRRDSAS